MIRLAGASSFQWSTEEQVYPFETHSDGSTLYAKQVNVGNLPNDGLLQYALTNISVGLTEDKIYRLWGDGIQTSPDNRYLPVPFSYPVATYIISIQAYNGNIEIETNHSYAAGYVGIVKVIYKK